MNVVAVKFKGYKTKFGQGQDYHYLTNLDLKVDDSVIVDSPTEGYVVVVVSKICGPTETTKASKWVVQKVDDEDYKRREEIARKKAVIETKLRAIERQVESQTKFQYLASISPEAKRLLDELSSLCP